MYLEIFLDPKSHWILKEYKPLKQSKGVWTLDGCRCPSVHRRYGSGLLYPRSQAILTKLFSANFSGSNLPWRSKLVSHDITCLSFVCKVFCSFISPYLFLQKQKLSNQIQTCISFEIVKIPTVERTPIHIMINNMTTIIVKRTERSLLTAILFI